MGRRKEHGMGGSVVSYLPQPRKRDVVRYSEMLKEQQDRSEMVASKQKGGK